MMPASSTRRATSTINSSSLMASSGATFTSSGTGRTKEARARVARLRLVRDRADFNKAKAERGELSNRYTVLIEARGETDGVGERQPKVFQRPEGRAHETPRRTPPRCLCAEHGR